MRKKQIQIGITVLILLAGAVYYWQGSKKSANESTQSNSPSTENLSVEDLIKQSAEEIINPSASQLKSSKSTITLSDACIREASQTFTCYEDYYKGLVKGQGVTAAFDDLKIRYDQSAYIKSQCHPITHTIGTAATEIYPGVGTAYSKGDSFCWSGYYHGVMEGIIGRISREELASKMDGICNAIPGKASYSFDYYNCVHGLGNGVMAISQNELFESLELCDNLGGSWEQSSCHGGAFMENVIIDNKNHFTKYLKPEEPLYPCTQAPEQYKGTCFLMQTSYMLKVTGRDFKKVFGLCATAPQDYQTSCYQSLGRDASGQSVSNIVITKNTCELGQDFAQKANCIIGAAKDFVSYFHSDKQALQLCDSLTTDLQTVCNQTVTAYYK